MRFIYIKDPPDFSLRITLVFSHLIIYTLYSQLNSGGFRTTPNYRYKDKTEEIFGYVICCFENVNRVYCFHYLSFLTFKGNNY